MADQPPNIGEIVRKLRQVEACKTGDPIPEFLDCPNQWGPVFSLLCGQAADIIEKLSHEQPTLEEA